MPLRPYQVKAIDAIRTNYTAGTNRQLLCMATGTGKTEVFAHLIEEVRVILPGKMMVILHRDELAKQAYNKIVKRNPDLKVHIEAGNLYADPDADVVIASVQTLGRKGTKRLEPFLKAGFDKFVVDEAHRSIADSYYNVYEAFGLLADDNKNLLLGVTATPVRGDGQGLGKLYQKISYTYPLRKAIEEGYLVDVLGIRINTKVSLDDVHTKGGDFDQEELADAVNNPYRNKLVAKAYLDAGEDRQAIGFSVNIAHAQALAEEFKSQGINAEYVYGADPERHKKIRDFKAGKIKVLFNAQLLTEGFDLDTIGCVILAAPTKSGVVFSQRIGRGTRLPDGYGNISEVPEGLKKDCIVLDVCDSTSRHSLVTLPTLLGMPKGLDLNGHGLLAAAKIIEEKALKYPHLDFSKLESLDEIDSYIEQVNLFEVKFPAEVESNSEFTWYPCFDGGFILILPDKETVKIQENLLTKWDIQATIKGKKYKGQRDSMAEAFSTADSLIRDKVPEVLKVVKREASWHSLPPTEGQMKLVRKLYKGKQIPDLTRGAASKLISSFFAGKGEK